MAWLVLSTSSLLDDRRGDDVPQEKLESLVRRSGYKPVTLANIMRNIMRNSANITSATSSDSLEKYNNVIDIARRG